MSRWEEVSYINYVKPIPPAKISCFTYIRQLLTDSSGLFSYSYLLQITEASASTQAKFSNF